MLRKKLEITGLVQGIGFRPAIYRLAGICNLTGFVINNERGVVIEVQGAESDVISFLEKIQKPEELPGLARIDQLTTNEITPKRVEDGFEILSSRKSGEVRAQVSPDLAVCSRCLDELLNPADFRHGYPFINCTDCGPRYSIIRTVPYDRQNTTMSVFEMCPVCRGEYEDIDSRRFHAQPVACSLDGPCLYLTDRKGNILEAGNESAVNKAVKLLQEGKIMAVKGIGGFHLAADAYNENAIQRLREVKRRAGKPFAMMARDIETIEKIAYISPVEKQMLCSRRAPIVLLKSKANNGLSEQIGPGLDSSGLMLPYCPLHYLIFEKVKLLVMTSANISEEPLVFDNESALKELEFIADAFLMHDRDIYRPIDDSVVQAVNECAVLIRRARGFVPEPIFLDKCGPQVLAVGSDIKNTICVSRENKLICSEHIGDLANSKSFRHFTRSIEHFCRLFETTPELVVCDSHPGYLSTQFATENYDVPVMKVQHHWAHAASVMAEHQLNEDVLAIVCDGTGYGTDGNIWGCEIFRASPASFERMGHLEYFPLCGADKASKEAIRSLIGLLSNIVGSEQILAEHADLIKEIEPNFTKVEILIEQMEKKLNCIQTSSLGRIFDVVAAILGLGSENSFDGQLPMLVESIIRPGIKEKYNYQIQTDQNEHMILRINYTIMEIIKESYLLEPGVIAAKFHNTLIDSFTHMALWAREKKDLNKIVLSGGVFCNKYLLEGLSKALKNEKFEIYHNKKVPSNDGGIALGQAFIGISLLKKLKEI